MEMERNGVINSHEGESDDRRTPLGEGYTVGSIPVNIRGKPMSDADLSKTGGWIAAFFIFGRWFATKL